MAPGVRRRAVAAAALAALLATPGAGAAPGDPAQVAIGERLFLETRFAQWFFAQTGGDPNRPLAAGDPVVERTETTAGSVPGPFAGQAVNCRFCHLVGELRDVPGAGARAYADFARRSPVPARGDGVAATLRNAPALVGAARRGRLLHLDGEFPSTAALVRDTLTGRNFGWLPAERATAVAHVARVVREDDGGGALARATGGAYRVVLGGTDPVLPRALRLPPRLRVDVARASDDAVVDAVARLVAAYVESLAFAHDSPYDRFLVRNALPRRPRRGESPAAYVRRLRRAVDRLAAPAFVPAAEARFALHDQPFVFGPLELDGLRVFLRESGPGPGVGSCAACHPPPHFTDFAFHNTGVAQKEYDAVHGAGRFAALAVPGAAARAADPDAHLPASAAHPHARGPFRARPDPGDPGRADLGLWNVLLNPDFPGMGHQRRLARQVCRAQRTPGCARAPDDALLAAAVGLFRTPGLRDLGHSGPYLHTGDRDTLEDVVAFYETAARLAGQGALRNAAPELSAMRLGSGDVPRLAAFLRALNEDYE